MATLEMVEIYKEYNGVEALKGVSFRVEEGEFFVILGPSGAGKTTSLRLLAGLEQATSGQILVDGWPVGAVPPQQRNLAIMFESYALYPHMTVFDNIAFPLRVPREGPGYSREEIKARVVEMARVMEIYELLARYPVELSGGQRQRVALCRTLVRDPYAFLLDEPISHLDAKLRHWLRGELKRRLKIKGVPVVWTSPDGLEAMSVADRVAVLFKGEVLQVGPPEEIYFRPGFVAVARLLGDPPINVFRCELSGSGEAISLRGSAFEVRLRGELAARSCRDGFERDGLLLGIRPSDITVTAGENGVRAEVYIFEPLGKYGILTVRVGEELAKVKVGAYRSFTPGERVSLMMDPDRVYLFDARTGRAL